MQLNQHHEDRELMFEGQLIDESDDESETSSSGRLNPDARRRLEDLFEQRALNDLLDDDFDHYLDKL